MATVILVRHGRTAANAAAVLAGRSKGVHLDEVGNEQALLAAQRLAGVRLARLVTSPLERTRETAAAIARAQSEKLRPVNDKAIIEVDYGDWQGQKLKDLAKQELWRSVQNQPSTVTFPNGESLASVSARAVSAVRRHDAQVSETAAVWALISHGDVIKLILAESLGTHLDQFQRIVVDPGSVSVIHFGSERPYVLSTNTRSGEVAIPSSAPQAVVGGGAGTAPGSAEF